MVNDNPTFLDRQYGVVFGTAKDKLVNPVDPTRYEIRLDCEAGTSFRVSVRVRSTTAAPIRAYISPALPRVTKFNIPALAITTPRFRPLEVGPQVGEGLDYLRDDLFDLANMEQIPEEPPGISLANLVDSIISRAVHTEGARVVAFGQAFKDSTPDKLFHFAPAWGMHDIHMMQGWSAQGQHAASNRVYGDGALFIWFPPERELAALFIRFDTQQLVTDQYGVPALDLWRRP
jgi:Uncharacterized conserved protein (DUF2278)